MKKVLVALLALTIICAYSLPQVTVAAGDTYTISAGENTGTGSGDTGSGDTSGDTGSGDTSGDTGSGSTGSGSTGSTTTNNNSSSGTQNSTTTDNSSNTYNSGNSYSSDTSGSSGQTGSVTTDNNKLEDGEVSILFTSDLNSHLDRTKTRTNGKTKTTGGIAAIATKISDINDEYNDSFVVDAGNFTTGTIFDAVTASGAYEMKALGDAGYDAVNLGVNEFGLGKTDLRKMINEAETQVGEEYAATDTEDLNTSGMPYIVGTNISWTKSTDTKSRRLKRALTNYGAEEYKIIKKEDATVAIFGLMDEAAVEEVSGGGLDFEDYKNYAQDVMKQIEDEDPDMVIALVACGSDEKISNGASNLAAAVDGIDVMVCSGTGEVSRTAVTQGNTTIVSAGENGEYLGQLLMKKSSGKYTVKKLKMNKITGSIDADTTTQAVVDSAISAVDDKIFDSYNLSYSSELANNGYDFSTADQIKTKEGDDALGDLLSDAYYWQAKHSGVDADVAFVSAGELSGTLYKGSVTPADVYNCINAKTAGNEKGYNLVKFYLTGRELKNLAEMDASFSVNTEDAKLYFKGLSYTTNKHRLKYNRSTDVMLTDQNGKKTKIDNSKLYCVVTDRYFVDNLNETMNRGLSLLSVEPKDKDGVSITDDSFTVLKSGSNNAVNWSAVSNYIKANGISTYYSKTHGRKNVNNSFSPVALFKQPNSFARIIYAIIIIPIVIIIGIVLFVKQRARRRRGYGASMFASGRRPRRTKLYKSKFK
jgi:5'-nucleotidase/UDP-sugar diphosphatase